MDVSDDFNSRWRSNASVETIRRRSEIVWQIRCFFHRRGFLEVQTPTLSADTVVDQHIEPIAVPAGALGVPSLAKELFLQTSPEFAMKRMVASGCEAIYQIAPAYRATERGPWHNPEFSMIEWYRTGDAMQEGVELLAALAGELFGAETAVTTYRIAFADTLGLDPILAPIEALAELASKFTGQLDWSLDRDELLNLLFAECVQPDLGARGACIVTNYPATQSALAKISSEDPDTAERFELFAAGIELANGYNELTDAKELRSRNRMVNAKRCIGAQRELPENSRLLDAMDVGGLPQCSGCAMGLDRLVAVLLGAKTIDEVIALTIERA